MKNNKQIKKHTEEYIHIRKPDLKKIGNSLLGLILLTLSYLNLKLIIYKWKELGLDVLFNCEENCSQFANLIQLEICFNLIIEAGLILFGIIFLFNLLNKINLDEFINLMVFGIFWGLCIGLVMGLSIGLFVGLTVGLVWGLFVGTIVGLTIGLVWVLDGGDEE
jgi:hypothetical protein